MRIRSHVLFPAFLVALSACGCTSGPRGSWSKIHDAICYVAPTPGNTATGIVTLTDTDGGLHVRATITGLTPGSQHGFHVHQHGYSGSDDAKCTGGHFDPNGYGFHALPGFDGVHHAGDLGNLTADDRGRAVYEITVPNLSVAADNAVIGRAIIIHAKPDDGGQPTGNAGLRIGVGNIAIAGDH